MVCVPEEAKTYLTSSALWVSATTRKILKAPTRDLWTPDYRARILEPETFPLYLALYLNGAAYELPPAYTKLTDEAVYLVSKFLSQKARYDRYLANFGAARDILVDRAPLDLVPIFEVYGLYFYAVYKDYYILAGKKGAKVYGTKLGPKVGNVLKNSPID